MLDILMIALPFLAIGVWIGVRLGRARNPSNHKE